MTFLKFLAALPLNFSYQVQLNISVDGKSRGGIRIGIYSDESPKAAINFLG